MDTTWKIMYSFDYINKHSEIEEILLERGVGITPYVPDPKGITRDADPMKLKVYLACGLPVVVTDVPWMAEIIKEYMQVS
jgi:glycosyltransferase involved in cell wall biosynthesis